MRRKQRAAGNFRGERGMALVAVLGFLVVMSLIAVSVIGAARSSMSAATRHLTRVQAQAAVESAISMGVQQLVAARGLRPAILSSSQELAFGGFKVTLAARPESAKIDLNFADVVLLMGMFRAAGADQDQASALASAVMDWRDGDDLLHVHGAEQREYEAAGLDYGPANKPFETVGALRQVLGVSAAIFACLKNEVTVYAQTAGVDLDTASPLVRRAAGASADNPAKRAAAQSVVSGQAIAAGEVFEIVARLDDAARKVRRSAKVVVRITGNPRDPYWTLFSGPDDGAKLFKSCPSEVASAF